MSMTTTIKFFEFAHLPEKLQRVSRPIGELARMLEDSLPDGPEKSAGMRKLLEAKDWFVRAELNVRSDDYAASGWVCKPKKRRDVRRPRVRKGRQNPSSKAMKRGV